MTTKDVIDSFKEAASVIKEVGLEFEPSTLGGLTLGLADRILQIKEMEESAHKVTPVIAGQTADRVLRGIN
jgi:hypothetical protein